MQESGVHLMLKDIKVIVLIDNQWQELALTEFGIALTPQGTEYTIKGVVKEDEFEPYK